MSYLVLARKWRPRSFDTLIGQDHVVRALTHALDSGRLHHAWLFTGTRGVGKTTLARILAKSLNCSTGLSSRPCGQCQACTEIDDGCYVDYLELDAASNRGVDEMTQLLEQAVYAPSSGRYKVYMIDEVHMLTGHAFNAMLKTLEEPPEHVKFILATTDPQKIPVTVLSRCLQFNLKQMTVPAIVAHLEHILQAESIGSDARALRLLAQAAAGSMRDALSLLDQAISYCAGALDGAAVGEMLGTLDEQHLLELLRALAQGDAAGVLAQADALLARGLSFQAALGDLAVLLSRLAVAQRLGRAPEADPLAASLDELAGQLSADALQLFYSVAVHSRAELALAPDEYAGFVMACLRMLALLPEDLRAEKKTLNAPPEAKRVEAEQVEVKQAEAEQVEAEQVEAEQVEVKQVEVKQVEVKQAEVKQAEAEQVEVEQPEAESPVVEAPAAEAPAVEAPAAEPQESIPSKAAPAHAVGAPESEPFADEPVSLDAHLAVHDTYDEAQIELAGAQDFDNGLDDIPPWEELAPAKARLRPGELTTASWPGLVGQLALEGLSAELAANCELVSASDAAIVLRVASLTYNSSVRQNEALRAVLENYFGRSLELRIEYGTTGAATSRELDRAAQRALQERAEQAVAESALVAELQQRLGAQVLADSVRPGAGANNV